MCCALVGPGNKLYKMHGKYLKMYVFLRRTSMSWCIVKRKNQFYFLLLRYPNTFYVTVQHCRVHLLYPVFLKLWLGILMFC